MNVYFYVCLKETIQCPEIENTEIIFSGTLVLLISRVSLLFFCAHTPACIPKVKLKLHSGRSVLISEGYGMNALLVLNQTFKHLLCTALK